MLTRAMGLAALIGSGALLASAADAQQLQPLQEFERSANLHELERVARELEERTEAAQSALDEARARAGEAGMRGPGTPQPRIVNGVLTAGFPTTGALLQGADPGAAGSWCSGTLIGCGTFLTAAHCVHDDPTPANYNVFLTHGGVSGVADIVSHPDYPRRASADLAIVKLAKPVTGIAPTIFNGERPVPDGTRGTIAGFGRSGGFRFDYGLKRVGLVQTAQCEGRFSGGGFVCWNFNAPIGLPGEDSNTCNADSGGPLFVNLGSGVTVAGATSGGIQNECLAGDHSYDADVFTFRSWIEQVAGADLGDRTCGTLGQVGQAGATVQAAAHTLGPDAPERIYEFMVEPGTQLLRIAMNGTDDGEANFDLLVRAGGQPSDSQNDCTQAGVGQYGFCEFEAPSAGSWFALVRRTSGAGVFQVTATTFR
jgi:hypothetical protein